MSKTISITQEGPANALALNKDYSHVVIAGRNVFKVFAIDDEEFVESCNLRVGKNLNLNFSCNDVAWNAIEDNILATAATNGAVVVWNLNRSTRSKQEYVFSDHKRTVNKVSFNPVESNWLISGSQDGTMKTFDLRTKEAIKTFYSNTESVRDVQFSPHSHLSFSSVSENGNVQTWDMRRPDKCVLQFTAHSGPVFACDWHPETSWLATASRDKTIKVWEMSVKPTLEFTINTIASVGRIKWRPQNRYHIASVALVVDSSVNVWDIRRPYIPYAAWTHHKDVATGIAWRGDPNLCLTTSRDCTLFQHAFKDATSPAMFANPQGLAMSPVGTIAFASKANLNSSRPSKKQSLLRKPIASSDEFWQASSILQVFSQSIPEIDWFHACAQQYKLTGLPLSEICDHNAAITRRLGRLAVSLLWTTIKMLYTSIPFHYSNSLKKKESEEEGVNKIEENGKEKGSDSNDGERGRRESSSDEVGRREETSHRTDEGLGDFFFGDTEMDPLSLDFEINGLDGLITQDWTLQVEAFPLRHELKDQSPPPEQFINNESPHLTEMITSEEVSQSLLNVRDIGNRIVNWDWGGTVASSLREHAALGDLQTPVCVLLALGHEKRLPLLNHIHPAEQETWLSGYLELLSRHRLWVHSTLVIRLSWLPCISELNQQSTTIYTGCSNCNKPLNQTGWLCQRCGRTSRCSVCHEVVRGLYAWCQGCMHGGHLAHMQEWVKNNTSCPTGCGHACEFS